ncbi:MAG: hypothetical protein HY667_03320 [Chloroflexi bacterium]|nr:hypothetical protein [Chloroflexota bacterium]
MAIASSMRELTQDIASSHEDRMKTVGQIKEETERLSRDTRNLIKSLQSSRSETGRQLGEDLSCNRAARISAVKKMRSDVQGIMTDLQASRIKESAQLRKEFAQGVDDRRASVHATLGDTRQTVSALQSQRQESGAKLRQELAESRADRESAAGTLIQAARYLVRDLDKSRQDMGKKLREYLARSSADRESKVKEMHDEFRRFRAEVRSDMDQARIAWQELIGGTRLSTMAPPPESTKRKAKGIPRIEEETPALEAKLILAIWEHPEGITLAEVAKNLDVAPIVLGRVSRTLLDKAKIRKEGKLYFPMTGE